MRIPYGLIVAAAMASSYPAVHAEPPGKPEDKAAKLRVGDPAPPLRVSKWLNGDAVKRFEPGKVYVVEFWATWCGPCIGVMPHLTALQTEYRKKGLTVIGVTARDENNSAAAVEAFVAKRGQRNAYTFAYCDDRETYDAYMTAAGLDGIPTAFVVGPTGKIEFIGHAMELDLIVPRVMSGTWRGQPDIDEVRKEIGRFNEIMKAGQTDPAAALKEFAAFETAQPKLVAGSYYRLKKLQLLLLGKRYEDASTLTRSMIQYGVESQDAFLLNGIRLMWSLPPSNPDKKHPDMALKAAEAELMIEGDADAAALYHVAEAHALAGDWARTGEYGKKAIAAAQGADRKRYEAGLKKLLDGKPDK